MKKSILVLAALLLGFPCWTNAEPLSFEQAANVTGSNGGFELGGGASYGYQRLRQEGDLAARYVSDFPIFMRLGFTGFEFNASVPYSSLSSTIEESDVRGFRDVGVGLKLNTLIFPALLLGVGVNGSIPTVAEGNLLFGEGAAVNPFAAFDILTSNWLFHVFFGYNFQFQYQRAAEGQDTTVTFRPGNQWQYGVGTEIGILNELWLLAELSGTYYGEARSAGDFLPGSQGNVWSVYPGLRLQVTPLKVKAGVEIPLRSAEDRPTFVPTYDWRVLGTVSFLIPFGSTSAKAEKQGY